jgi:lipopolysaccharide transport system ATP-binding protein
MSDIAIRVQGLSKLYRLGEAEEGYRTLRESLTDTFMAPFRRLHRGPSPKREAETIWALKDVSFEVKHGEVIGIIGRNGAGKSTLLKILSRITEPTEGHAEIHGRVGSLLEVGTGFHPELTGRENIFLNGAILGMKKAEIIRKFDEIVAFAEVERFIDTPVKHYSSGMYVRLAFAVAAHLDPDILIVDEVLAVGDAAFQRKCLGKIGDVAAGGRTVLFVSHNMGAVARLCNSGLLLQEGRVAAEGTCQSVILKYEAQSAYTAAHWQRKAALNRAGISFTEVKLTNKGECGCSFSPTAEITVHLEYVAHSHLLVCSVGARIVNAQGVVILTTGDCDYLGAPAGPREAGVHSAQFTIPGSFLCPGTYTIFVAANFPNRETYEVLENPVGFEVSAAGSLVALDGRLGLVAPLLRWRTELATSDSEGAGLLSAKHNGR